MAKKNEKNRPSVHATTALMKKAVNKGCNTVQSHRNHHAIVGECGKIVYHASYDHLLIENQPKNAVDDYLTTAERPVMP